MRICVICARPPGAFDAVGDACWRLAEELACHSRVSLLISTDVELDAARGPVTLIPVRAGWGWQTAREVLDRVSQLRPDVLLVHFVPQLYGWNGTKPGLAFILRSLRRRGYPIVTVAHEFAAPFGLSPKLIVWSTIHRVLWRIISRSSRRVVATTESRCRIAQKIAGRVVECRHIPIGSTIPVVGSDVAAAADLRGRWNIPASHLVIATFGSNVDSSLGQYRRLFRELVAAGVEFDALLIGKAGHHLYESCSDDPAVTRHLRQTGPVPSTDISKYLSLSDLYVAFYPDGASTHRTSLLAGLSHGVATVSNRGVSTELAFESSGAVELIDWPKGLDRVRMLCRDRAARLALGQRGREYHDLHHSWSQIGQAYLQVMSDAIERN